MKEIVLYAVKIGDPDYMEEVLYSCKGYTNKAELLTKAEEWTKINGYDRIRIAEIDLSILPDFTKTIK